MDVSNLSETFYCQSDEREWVDRCFFSELEKACDCSDIDLANELIRSNPEEWKNLDSNWLEFLIDRVLMPKDVDEARLKNGKKELFYLITSHDNWNPTELYSLFYLLYPQSFPLDREESFEMVCAFLQVNSLEEISVGTLTDLVSYLLHFDLCGYAEELFQIVASLPNWKRIPSYAYDKILQQVNFRKCSVEALEILFSHPKADRLKNLDLKEVAEECVNRGEIMEWLAKDERWNDLPAHVLYSIVTPAGNLSKKAIDLILSHPHWSELTTKEVASLGISICHFLTDELRYSFFLHLTSHPKWENLTKAQLQDMAHRLPKHPIYKEKGLHIIQSHKNWL